MHSFQGLFQRKSIRPRCAGHIAHMSETLNVCEILVALSEGGWEWWNLQH